MCEKYEWLADQRDGYMRRMEQAIESEELARSQHAQCDDVEMLEGDREALLSQNAELTSRAERALRLLMRWRLQPDSNRRFPG